MNFKDLLVWQKSVLLAKNIYKITKNLPKTETYGLASQMQRSAVSIPSNIAEGHDRNHTKEFIQFLAIAYGSCSELETQITIAKSLYTNIDYSSCENLLLEVRKMISGLSKSLKNN